MAEMFSNATNETTHFSTGYKVGLVFMYSLILLGGAVGTILMSTVLRSNMLSITTVSVINLLVVHLLFLLTVPFRIYYFTRGQWDLGYGFCKMVSSMIHAHMFLSFIFYIIILIARYLAFFEWGHIQGFFRTLHAVIASMSVWAIVLGSALPATIITYGSSANGTRSDQMCFEFGSSLTSKNVRILNYFMSAMVLSIWTVLACVQLLILWRVYRRYGQASYVHQEFWAQIKSLCFVLIMFICFVPYNAFRIYYINQYTTGLQEVNEVFLTFTAFSCFDILAFAGKKVWRMDHIQCCSSCERKC
ncbi:probable G-protein coupled receptor 141 isoform X2 [Hoplias malabaricus]